MLKLLKKHKWWMLLVIGLVFVSLLASAKTYLSSVNREEVKIAEVGGITTNPFNLSEFTHKSKLKIYEQGWGYPITFKIKHGGTDYSYEVHNTSVETDFEVDENDSVSFQVYFPANVAPYGWKEVSAPDTRHCATMLQSSVSSAQANNETIVSKQCWNDENEPDTWDEFVVVITQMEGDGSGDDSDDEDEGKDEARFVIRAFEDEDEDRNWDEAEGSVGENIEFEYRVNGTDWKEYEVDSDSGWGKVVNVGIDSKVEVKGENIGGFTMTVDSPKVKILDDNDTYYFDFGYVSESSGVGSNGGSGNNGSSSNDFPATQPDTGTATWLTLGVVGLGLGLLLLRKRLK